jgi:uncharacterized protein (TIGR00255 family)
MQQTIHSMTGFARAQTQGDWGVLICELRSINHRYLEVSVHLPESLRELENAVREQIRHHVKRGKVECYVRYQPSEMESDRMSINAHFAEQLCRANQAVAKLLKDSVYINTMDILRWPGVLEIPELDLETLEDEMTKLLEKGLTDLVEMRAREGNELKELFMQRLDIMHSEVTKVKVFLPQMMTAQREKLIARFADAKLELDPERVEQEIVLFAQRIDIAEELDRLTTHIAETRRILKQGGVAGRRLDFLMQELHREANTLGSKSVGVETTHASVELKVLIEQMREQVQNVE